jgi:hypothetical protein
MANTAGRVLVVGGGRAGPLSVWDAETETWYPISAMPRHPQGRYITLNRDFAARPDVVGDINRSPFASQTFIRVYFERVEWVSFTGRNLGAINESARLLMDGGQLLIETGSGVRAQLPAITQRMREVGFRFVRVSVRKNGSIRISGRWRDS